MLQLMQKVLDIHFYLRRPVSTIEVRYLFLAHEPVSSKEGNGDHCTLHLLETNV